MQDLNENPTSTYESSPQKKIFLYNPSMPLEKVPSYYKSYKYADIGFTITKRNKKYVAHCRVCDKILGNTAYARLKGHRNICRAASLTNDIDYAMFSINHNEENVNGSQQLTSQTSNDSPPMLTLNVMSPTIEKQDSEVNSNLLPFCNTDPESYEEYQLMLNMIEVLLPIKYNKKLLLEDNTQESINLWIQILRKAQSLGLAPLGISWTYARDSLYSVWKHHTLEKKEAMKSGELNVKFNIVDVFILQLEDAPMTCSNSENENFYEPEAYLSKVDKTTGDTQRPTYTWTDKNKNSITTQTTDEMYKVDLQLKLLQCEAMEIENYKRSLEVLELERKLRIPHSKFTNKYFSTATENSLSKDDKNHKEKCNDGDDASDIIKIELDD